MRVAITGSTGFIGSRLCVLLARAGHEVIAVNRTGTPLPGAAASRAVPDLSDRGALAGALEGVAAVVHLAARVHVMRETSADALAAFRKVNVEGTRVAFEQAARAGAQRFVYLSSIKVLGEGNAKPYTEDDPTAPVDPYAISKLEAERLLTAAGDNLPAWTILRPPLVYGPGVGANFRRLISLAARARTIPLPLGGITNARSLVFVDNLCDAIGAALQQAAASRHLFHVTDGEDFSTSELIERLALALGRRARLFPAPVSLLRALAAVAGRGPEADRLLRSLRVDGSHLRQRLNWEPPVSANDALRQTCEWWLGTLRSRT